MNSWKEFGAQTVSHFRQCPSLTSLIDSLKFDDSAAVEQRLLAASARCEKRRAIREKELTIAATKLRPLEAETKCEEIENRKIEQVYETIRKEVARKKRSINLFRLALDPESFQVSVRNLFYISSLTKDRRIKVSRELKFNIFHVAGN